MRVVVVMMMVVVVMIPSTATAVAARTMSLRLAGGGAAATASTIATLLLRLATVLCFGALHQRLDRVEFVLEPRRALLIDLDKLLLQLVEEVRRHGLVHVVKPGAALSGVGDLKRERVSSDGREECNLATHLPTGPLAGQVNAKAGDHGGLVLQTHGGQVQAVGRHEVGGLRQILARWK